MSFKIFWTLFFCQRGRILQLLNITWNSFLYLSFYVLLAFPIGFTSFYMLLDEIPGQIKEYYESNVSPVGQIIMNLTPKHLLIKYCNSIPEQKDISTRNVKQVSHYVRNVRYKLFRDITRLSVCAVLSFLLKRFLCLFFVPA